MEYIYSVNGKLYSRILSKPSIGLQTGEQYEVLYNPSEASESLILLAKPVLLDKKAFAVTWTIKVRDVYLNGEVEFSYQVDGKMYKRGQYLTSETKVNERKKYKVLYQIKNPNIAYIVI